MACDPWTYRSVTLRSHVCFKVNISGVLHFSFVNVDFALLVIDYLFYIAVIKPDF